MDSRGQHSHPHSHGGSGEVHAHPHDSNDPAHAHGHDAAGVEQRTVATYSTTGAATTSPVSRRDFSNRTTVAGMFHDRDAAEQAINALQGVGFPGDRIGVAMRDRTAQGELVEDTGTSAAEGAVTGAVGGGMLGGIVGLLVGIGALAIPGIGPVVAGGALATAFGIGGGTAVAGAGIGAAAGGVLGALVGMGIPEEEARHFESGFRAGGTLVTVNAGDRVMDALAVLERYGADTGAGRREIDGSGAVDPRPADRVNDRDAAEPGVATGVGTVGGAVAGAAAGSAVAGPVGTVVGGVAGAAAGAGAGAAVDNATGNDAEWTTDASGRRVRRTL